MGYEARRTDESPVVTPKLVAETADSADRETSSLKTKGVRQLLAYRDAAPECALPPQLLKDAVLEYDLRQIDLPGAIAELLDLPDAAALETYVLNRDEQGRSGGPSFPQTVHARARACETLRTAYERLLREVVGPHLLAFFPGESTLLYQWPPTVRVQCTADRALGRLHRDAQYGHQWGEVNFWVPLVELEESSTLWFESDSDRGDWRPILLAPGKIQRFHGTSCRHFTKPNRSGRTRVSLDFRCAARRAFDVTWQLPGVRHRHEVRELKFDAHAITSPVAKTS
eukprot:TRINITY_DN39701_c0_g1_i1.p1 TRINITY_DN39701_c0_g1~~TRINITY_DN39701_c0_g1_i1.p1  ORF type:complete len:316 (-),score=35.18 TRINITY_DN39701_c0_g1_i1:450-1301(-)